MGSFGDYYNSKKKKLSKEEQARKAARSGSSVPSWVVPTPAVIKKGKKDQPSW